MINDSTDNSLLTELLTQLATAAVRASQGIRDPETMRIAAESMDQLREEIRRKEGLLNIGVSAIRELRAAE